MIRKRTFELVQHNNGSSWKSFDDAYKYFSTNKDKVEKTFEKAVFDKNFNEPMNCICLSCDVRHRDAGCLQYYLEKFNELFSNNDDKIVITTRLYKDNAAKSRVIVDHSWFTREDY